MVLGTAGDRTDEAIHAMGAMAAAAADRLVVARRIKYQRGRPAGEMEAIWRAGAAEAGRGVGRRDARRALRSDARAETPALPDGSVVAVCALEQRAEMVAELRRRGGGELTPAEVAERVADRRALSVPAGPADGDGAA